MITWHSLKFVVTHILFWCCYLLSTRMFVQLRYTLTIIINVSKFRVTNSLVWMSIIRYFSILRRKRISQKPSYARFWRAMVYLHYLKALSGTLYLLNIILTLRIFIFSEFIQFMIFITSQNTFLIRLTGLNNEFSSLPWSFIMKASFDKLFSIHSQNGFLMCFW